jgi:hypothetical protein
MDFESIASTQIPPLRRSGNDRSTASPQRDIRRNVIIRRLWMPLDAST